MRTRGYTYSESLLQCQGRSLRRYRPSDLINRRGQRGDDRSFELLAAALFLTGGPVLAGLGLGPAHLLVVFFPGRYG